MGNTFQTCKTCQLNPQSTSNEPNQISAYYIARITQSASTQQLPNLPRYENIAHTRLINDLRNRDQKFVDMVKPNEELIFDGRTEWKRISEVYPTEGFSRAKGSYEFQWANNSRVRDNKGKLNMDTLAADLRRLSKFPELIEKMFANNQVSKEGFYVLYFCIGGDIQKRIQIVIDDYIPVGSNNRYLFEEPQKGDGIWMILVQKAWAKILKSYQAIESIQASCFFSEMTGVPKPEMYNRGDFLTSSKYDFNGNQSKYLKINRDNYVQMIVCIWLPNISQSFIDMDPVDFIAEVIVQKNSINNKRQYQLLPLTIQKNNNKILLLSQNRGPFVLPAGMNIIHIYNRSKSQRNCNIVIHSRNPVNSHTRYQKQYQLIKTLMVQNQYKKIHHKIGTQFQNSVIELKFLWMGHRGIFCLKNKDKQDKVVEMSIKKIYAYEIFFEDSGTDINKKVQLKPKEHAFFVVIRSEDKEYGPFYQIKVNNTSQKAFQSR